MDRGFHTASSGGHNLQFVPPMLLRRVPQLPEGPEWQYEVKWDGYRMQAIDRGGQDESNQGDTNVPTTGDMHRNDVPVS